jgi:hypothetical protein
MAPLPLSADTIDGELGVFGSFSPIGGTLADATGIHFNWAWVADATGDFGGLTPGSVVTMNNDVSLVSFSSVTPLWSVGGFSFDLLNLTIVGRDASHIALTGTGIVTYTPLYDPTAFNWSFSGDTSGGTLHLFSNTATSVPEPSELAALGLWATAILPLAAWSRKRRKTFQR